MNKTRLEHESYGMLEIHRTRGDKRNLFGSDVRHNNTVRLAINTADYTRNLSSDWFYSKSPLIEIELSPVQFAEVITNMNTQGVPCTIKYYNGKYMEDCPSLSKKEMFRKELQDDISEITNIISNLSEEVEEIIKDKKPINKANKEKILNGLYRIQQQLNSNMPYVAECFDEQMEKSVSQSKSEIEAYISHKINSLGLKALKEENSILEIEE